MDFTSLAALLSPAPESRGAALLGLLGAYAGVGCALLTALDGRGNHVVVASFQPSRSRTATTVHRLVLDDGCQVGTLRFTAAPGALAGVRALTPHLTAVADVVSRRLRLGLTSREGDILSALAEGFTNAEIARRECVSVRTVTTHVESIFRKLGVTNRVQAARVAVDCEMVTPAVHSPGVVPAQGLAAS